jgi:hypothetical protein
MKNSEILFFIGFGAVSTFVITSLIRDRLRKRRIVASLKTRVDYNDDQFGRGFYSDPKRADIAIRVRRVLSANLEMPLDGLRPSDRLNEDLNAELPINPHLFWDLETEFGIHTGTDDLETFEETLKHLVTFDDLVSHVEAWIAAGPSVTESAEKEESSLAHTLVTRSFAVLFVGGILVYIGGLITGKNAPIKAGLLILVSSFVATGLLIGATLLWNVVRTIRSSSGKSTPTRPLILILQSCVALFLLSICSAYFWGLLKKALPFK